jgi:hypothetical protein
MFLGDMTFVDEYPTQLEGGFINWAKFSLLASIIRKMDQYKSNRHPIKEVSELQKYLKVGFACLVWIDFIAKNHH